MINQVDLDALTVLIDCMKQTPILPQAEMEEKNKVYRKAVVTEMVEDGKSWGEASGGALSFLTRPDAPDYIRSFDNDLGHQTAIVAGLFSEFLQNGEYPAPYYAWRIAIILRKGKLPAVERDFLGCWCKHFGEVRGNRYEMIKKRFLKMHDKGDMR